MIRVAFLLVFLSTLSLTAHATELSFKEQYDVFNGSTVDIKKVVGKKPVYIKFWATWCLECREELPSLQSTYAKYGKDIAMFAVNLNINENAEYIQRAINKHNLTIPIVMDDNGSIASNFDFVGTPFHALIDQTGNVVYTTYKDDEKLAANIEKLADNGKFSAVKEGVSAVGKPSTSKTLAKSGVELVFLTATWCDSYMLDIHPDMAENCMNSYDALKKVSKKYSDLNISVFATYLWTENKDVSDFQKKMLDGFTVKMDEDNAVARELKVSHYPTLLVFEDGKEKLRIEYFSNTSTALPELDALLKRK